MFNIRSVIVASMGLAIALVALIGTPQVLAAGSGGGGASVPSTPIKSRPQSPEQQAEKAYEKGLKHKAKAWKAEEKAAVAKSDKRRAKDEKRVAKEYRKAQDAFAQALQVFPEHYKAANELGYVLRKQGNYKKAIGSYNYALQLYPDFLEAIEYRAEAFMAVGLYDGARESYMRLFREDAELAEQLMVSMQSWAADQEDPSAKARNFIEWIESRQSVSSYGELTKSTGSGW